MPTIDVLYSDLCRLAGTKVTDEDLLFAKCEIDGRAGDAMKLDVKDTNRPDLWSAEGVAREIRFRYRKGFPAYKTKKSGLKVIVDKSVNDVRPYTVCAVVKGLKISQNVLSQLIQLQEKVSGTFGRNRREVAIGVYDLGKIKPPIWYTTVEPMGVKFVPLDFDKELTPAEILQLHPKGREFGRLLEGAKHYPIFIDRKSNVLSIPPIINSAYTGKVDEKTKDIFIECSGFDMKFLEPAINAIVAALHERGGRIETVDVVYGTKKIRTPDLEPKNFTADIDYINKVSGLGLNRSQITELLQRSGYRVKATGDALRLFYPAYRQDIMHQRDVAEDALISYGYNSIEPAKEATKTKGVQDKLEVFSADAAEVLAGCGLQEILSYTLTNRKDVAEKMQTGYRDLAEIENPVSANWSVLRPWLLPSLLEFLARNKHVEYPQKIFEIGDCTEMSEKKETGTEDKRKAAAVISNSLVSYEDITSVLDAFMRTLGFDIELAPHSHASFISSRCAKANVRGREVGLVGEINPAVLNAWNLEKPVVAFELDLGELFRIRTRTT